MGEPANGNGNGFASRYGVIIQTVTVVALFIGGFWASVITPINARLDKFDARVSEMLSVREHLEFKEAVQRDLKRVEGSTVPRPEHVARWEATQKDLAILSERLNELRRDVGSTYTMNDKLKELQKQLDDIRSEKMREKQ